MAELNANLADLFAEHKDGSSGITQTGLLTFAADCNILGKGLKGKDISLVFSSVKVGKKDELNFDRFQEVCTRTQHYAKKEYSFLHWL